MPKITINALSAKSLNDAAKQVERIKKQYIAKNKTFVKELAKSGIVEARNHLVGDGDSEPPDFYTDNPYATSGTKGAYAESTLRLQGEDVAFVEFGAGVHYNGHPNSSPNPLGVKLGYTIGSYGWHQGLEDHWWYKGDDGEQHLSQGTEATMPLFHASEHIKQEYMRIAKEVFGS
jgi:hypothetical protein